MTNSYGVPLNDSTANYVRIADIKRKDFGCVGYIQQTVRSVDGPLKLIIRVYSPDDKFSNGTQVVLDARQVVSIGHQTFKEEIECLAVQHGITAYTKFVRIIATNSIYRGCVGRIVGNTKGDLKPYRIQILDNQDIITAPKSWIVPITELEYRKYERSLPKDENNYLNREFIDPNVINRLTQTSGALEIKKIIFNRDKKSTTIMWLDGEKTTVKCIEGETFSEYHGFTAAVAKRIYGGTGPIKKILNSKKTYQSKKKKKTFEDQIEEAYAKISSPLMEGDEANEDGR